MTHQEKTYDGETRNAHKTVVGKSHGKTTHRTIRTCRITYGSWVYGLWPLLSAISSFGWATMILLQLLIAWNGKLWYYQHSVYILTELLIWSTVEKTSLLNPLFHKPGLQLHLPIRFKKKNLPPINQQTFHGFLCIYAENMPFY